MDFGLDEFLVDLWKEHWLIYTLIFLGLIFLKFFFEDILPSLKVHFEDKFRFKWGMKFREDRELLKWLQSLHHTEFEKYVAEVFRNLGYRAELIGGTGDHGLDIRIEKNKIVSYVQCKRYSHSHKVGEPEVRNFLGSLTHEYVKEIGYFVTTSTFTMEAIQFARGEQIELINGLRLVEYIRRAEKNGFNIENEIEVIQKVCPDCGGELVSRVGKYGSFLGCASYPRCKYTESEE